MKAIQVMFDEKLLAQLDDDEEVRRDGRSAVLRRATAAYLRGKRAREISAAYRRAYDSDGDSDGADDELDGWSEEGVWPDP